MDLVQGVVTTICLIVLLCTLSRIVRLAAFLRHLISRSMTAKIDDPKPLHILLIGKTGHGKSSTGNSILGLKPFKTSAASSSETKEVKVAWAVCGSNEIKVIDGPGLEDTNLDAVQNKVQACENMAKALILCNGGVHAFLLVLKFGGRFTDEEKRTISDLKQIFGENFLKERGIIVITGGDNFHASMEYDGTPKKTFSEWCGEQKGYLGEILKECSPRVLLFNNWTRSEEEKRTQRDEILRHAEELRQNKGLYTSEHFKAFAQLREKMTQDSQLKVLEETVQKRIDLLSAELVQLSINSSLADVDRVDARIQDLYKEIREENMQHDSMKKLTASLKSLSSTTKELRRAIEDKNMKDIQTHLATLSTRNEELKKAKQIPWGYIFTGAMIGLQVAAKVIEVGASVVPQLFVAARLSEIAKVLFQTQCLMTAKGGPIAAMAALKHFTATGSFLAPVPTALSPVNTVLASTGTPLLNLAVAIIQNNLQL